MATILELAQHADLPAETVLRVILRESTSEDAQRRVAEAVAELGPPDYPRPNGNVDVVPDDEEPELELPEAEVVEADMVAEDEPAEPESAEDEPAEPESAGPEVVEPNLPAVAEPVQPPALDEAMVARIHEVVQPAVEQAVELRTLFHELAHRLSLDRKERVEDLELVTELISEGWRGVDRRLGRIEKALARLEEAQASAPGGAKGPTVVRLEDWVRQPFGETSSSSDRS